MKLIGRGTAGLLGVVLAAGGIFAAGSPVAASEREREGDCSGRADWELEVEREGGGLEVELEIEAIKAGKVWDVRIKQNGNRFFKANLTTDREGEIEVERQRPDTAGPDKFWFKAINQKNGQVCQGSLTY
ncbi:MAG: hypothetical protein M3395_10130 [Chloroflexota bacterium]|nr:hypothetical protein [Chloroflexota bacterium]